MTAAMIGSPECQMCLGTDRVPVFKDKGWTTHAGWVFDLVHTINDDGTEQRFDFNKVVPEPTEFPPVPATASDFERSYHTPRILLASPQLGMLHERLGRHV